MWRLRFRQWWYYVWPIPSAIWVWWYGCGIKNKGYLPLDKKAANYLFQLISKCYERKSLIVSSNKGFEQWGEIFLLRGENYRMKGKMEKGGGSQVYYW
ncbi:MAG TPA: hypothetical protein ENI35_00645 [Candidatus Desulfofervidus auxilii]|uniref:IstB-like ATP-binding domain-containing protein n=1 Tax=Desulfofervidus auxilii TaxID=1621989 RepID=A0A7C2A7N1_DESA2|nr:hypothetical protein [Candidatus Desulfofervidus auxilii]